MNKIFKVIWSKSKQCYIVVSEMAKNHSGKKKIVVASILAAMAVGADMSASVHAVDEGTAKPGGIALGSGSFAGSDGSIALGKKSYAVGTQRDGTTDPSIAIGQRAVAIGNSSLAVGLDTDIRNSYAVAVGRYATVNGDYGIGMGFKSVATEHATAVGESARSKKMGAAAYGVSARGYSQGGVAIGIQSLAGANTFNADGTPKTFIWDDDETTISNYQKFGDVSIGLRTMATGGNATALGRSAAATAANSIAIGGGDGNKLDDNKERTQASAEKAAAIGYSAFASGTSASALGTKAKASAENAAAIGTGAKASANDAFAAGTGAEASEANATALGKGASAEKADAIAIGTGATSGGTSGIAMGNDAQAQAKDTIAVGSSSRASNDNDSAFGNAATAAGSGSTAIGYQANTTAANSTAIGAAAQSTKASATALGNGAKAFSTSGIAIGEGATVGIAEGRTTAGTTPAVDASNSIAIGKNAKVLAGSGSIALGANTQITASDVATSSGSAQKTYPYMLTNTKGTDAVADKENGIVAIGTKRSSADSGFARRLTGVAGGVSDYDAVNLKQAKAIESSLKKGERHIKATSYSPDTAGTITLNYVDGENNDVFKDTATITDVAKKSDEWMLRTQNGTTTTNANPQTVTGSTKKAVTLKAGDNIAIDNSGGTVTIKAKDVVTSITSGNATALTVSPSNGAVTITPNIASSVGASGEEGKLVTSGVVKTALDAKIDKTAEMHIKTGEYTVGDDGKASLVQQDGTNQDLSTRVVIKDIAKKSVVDGINTTVGTHTTQISNLTTAVGGKVSQSDFDAFKAKAITFTGDDNGGVARTLGTTLTVKGGANYTSNTTTNTNIRVEKDGTTGLLVKLSDTLTGMKGISGDGKTDLVIKNGTNTVTIKPGKDNDKGTVNFGDAKVIASNLEADITYRANSVADTAASTVKLKKGLNFVAATDATTATEGPKAGLSITTGADGLVTFGLDKATREKVDNAADKNLSNLSETGNNKITNLAKAAAKETVKVAPGINTTVDTDTTTTEGVTTYKVNANDTKVAIAGDGLAISGGDLGATDRVREYTLDLSATTKGKLTAVGNLASVIGGTTITADGTVTGPTFNITNAAGGTDSTTTLKDAIDKLNKTNEGQNTTISNLTTTVTNNYNDLSTKITNAGTAATAAATTKGLNFTGDDTTDNGKVHRDLGETLTIKGGENFTRGTSENNIKVVKNNNDLDVKLAENLGNIKEISGDGKTDLVIKNGTNTVTITPGKDDNKGTVNFGDAKVIASNLEADITYRANSVADTAANTVKLKKGLNFVAATDATTATEGPKAGLSITTGADGLVTFGLDKATREKVDNAADKNLSNLSETGNNKITNLAKAAAKETVKVAPGINTTVDTDTTTTEGVTTYKVNANDTKVAIAGDGLAISGGDLGATDRVREYTLDLSATTKGKLTAVGNLANVIGGTTITTDGTVTGPTFNITNAAGGTDTANTLKDAIDKLNTTNAGQNTTISNLTTTVTNNYNDLSTKITNAGTAATAAATAKGLNFTGDDTTDNGKVHRDLGDTLTIKGGENFVRGASENNIKVVKTSNDLAVKLAKNLGNIEEISGDGSKDLVIKNGDTKVTVKAPKDGGKGSIDFGDTKLVTNNLDANIFYKAGTETDKKTVKLQDGFNFVAGTGTVAATTPATGATTTTSPTASTDNKAAKKGIVISTEANGVVNIGLDSDTRSAIDNAASKNYVENALTNLNSTITGNANLNFAGNVTKDAQDKDADKVGLSLATGTLHIKGDATDITTTAKNDTVTIGLTDTTKNKLKAIGNLATVIGGTTINTDGTVTGPTFNITNAAGGTDSATTLKDAIDKLNKTNEGQNTTISNLTTTVTNNYNDLSTKITNAGTAATAAATTKGLNFTGDDTTDNGKVHRDLGETLTIKGGENFTRGTSENNIKVVKNNNDLDVKLAENLGNIKEIAGDGTHDLVIKNGDTKVTVKAPKDGNKGSIDFGDTKLVTNNLDANISYKAGTEADKKTVKLQDGFNFVAGTGTVAPKHLEAGTASPTATTDSVEPKKGIAISTAANGVVNIGLDSDTRGIIDNAASKDYVTTELANLNTTITGNANLNFAGNVTKDAQDADVAKVGLALATGTLHIKGDATDITTTAKGDTVTIALTSAAQGKLTAVGNLASVIGGTTIAADGTVTGPTFNITNATGGTDSATTLKDAIDKLNKTNEGQNTTISNLTTTVTNNYNDLSTKITNAGTAATAAATTKGLNFTGDDTTDNGKVHRDLGETLTIKGGENFTRGTSENNIKVVKNNNDLDVKLAENLGNIKEIAGDGTHDLVIKNGDTKVTVKAPKDGNKGSIDFGDTKLVTNNLDANISYKAGTEADKKTVKLQDGFNFVAGTGTVAPKHLEAGTASPTATTDSVEPKKGIAISTAANGVVNIGLDSDTRGIIDNAASKDYVATELANLNTTITGNANLNFAGNVTKDAQDADVAKVGLALATGTLHIKGDTTDITTTAKGDTVTIGLTDATKGKLTAVDGLATVIGGTNITADGTVTGPTFNITKADGTNETASTIKEAIEKLNTTNAGQNTAINNLTNTVNSNYNDLSTKITNAGTATTNALTEKGLDFYGNKDTEATDKVHRNLGEALKVKGAENFTREATATNNIDVVKNTAGDGFDVKLAENLGNIKEIAGDGTHDLVIKNGDTKVTVKAPKDGNKGSIDFGDTKLVTNNLEADITYRANSVPDTEAKSVKLRKGLNFVASDVTTTTEAGPKSGLAITAEDDGKVTFGLDKATREKVDNAADKNLSNLSEAGSNKVTELAKAAAKEVVKVAPGINTTVDTDTTTTEGVTTYKVNANDTKVAITGDGLAISGGDLGTTDRVRTYTLDLSDATKGKLTAVGGLATVIGGTTIADNGTVTGPTFNITNATGGTDSATTLKDAIDKLNATNAGQNTTISNLTKTVNDNYNDLSTKITNAGTTATNALTEKGLDFYGNKDVAETDKVHRNLGQALKVKGAENFTREATATNNIDVVKNTAGDGFDVKLAENLGNIKEIAGDGTHDLVIKNGDTKVTVKAPKDGNKGSIDFGDTKLVTNNLDANISYKAGTEADKKTVKLQDGFNFVAGTGTVAPKHLEAGTASPTATTDSVEPKKGIAISTAANGVVNIGLDSDTRGAIDNAADKNLSNLSEAGNNKITNLAKAAAKETVKVAPGINTTVDTDTTTTEGVTTYKVNANDTKVAIAGDGLAISGGDLGATDRVREYTLDLSATTKGKLTAVGNLANVIGGTTIAADGTVTGPTFNITNATGGTDTANTLKDAIDKLNKTNEGQNTTISNLTTTVTNNYNDLSTKITNAGAAATNALTEKGLDFYGNKDAAETDKVHRNLGQALKVKGAENFTREATATNNIDVVKNTAGDGFDVKLAENLGNIKEIAGDGTHDLVIKNGDTKVTVKAPKDGNKGSIDFGDTKLVTNNLDANISYKAGTETDKKTVKLQDGFNFVAGTGTVAPKHLEAGTASPTATTDSVEPKKGIAISTAANGVVNIGLDSDTRGAIDNAADKNLSNLSEAGNNKITNLAKAAAKETVKVAPGINTTVDTDTTTTEGVTTYKVNANDTKVAIAGDGLAISGGDLGATDRVREYTLDLSATTKGKLTAVGNLANVIGGTTIAADGTVTGPTFNITNATGGTDTANTLKDAIDKLNKTNEGQNTTISDLTTTVTNNYNDLSTKITNAGTAATAAATAKGLNFTGDDTTDNGKVHRDLGDTLTIKGGENFVRGASENNIKVVKTSNDLAVKLAKNLGNIEEISGDGSKDLVIKNGDTKVTVKAPKDGGKGSIDFGDTKLITNNLDANISYKAGTETDKKTVKLQDGFNFVAGTGTVAPKHLEAGTVSPTEATDSVEPKKGIAISTAANGVVNIGLDSDTRGAIDNASNQDLSNLTTAGKKVITDAAQGSVKVAAGKNVTIDTETKDNVTTYTVNANDTLVTSDNTLVTVNGGTLGEDKVRTYTLGLSTAVTDKLAQLSAKNADGRDGKLGSETDAIASKDIAKADGLNGETATYKVNALRHGEAGSVVYTDADGNRIVKATDGNYYKATEVNANGVVKTPAENNGVAPVAVEKATIVATLVNTNGTTAPVADDTNKVATTKLTNIKEAAITATSNDAVTGRQLYGLKSDLATYLGGDSKVNADGTFTGPTYNITKDDGTNTTDPVKNVGDAITKLDTRINNANTTLSTKGLDFYGNKDAAETDKVHRNLGEALKVKGAENFTREATAKNNIDVVKNATGDGFDIKLAKNLGNIEEIAGDGKTDLVIKNGDTKVTIKAPKAAEGTNPAVPGSIDFGDTKLVTNNLEADITYRANGVADTAAHKVKLQKGLNFVAGSGTVAQPAASTTPATGGTTTPATPPATDSETTKSGIVITTGDDGKVTIGLDATTRSAIDNAANQDLSNLTTAGKKVITDAAQGAVKVAAGNNVTIGKETKDNVTTYTVNGRDTTVKAAENGSVSVTGGTLNDKGEREYTVDLTDATKAQINRIDGIDTRLTTAENNITTLQGDMKQAKQDITTLQGDMKQAKADIITNAGNIATNTTNITKNAGNITINATNIGKNAEAIQALQGNSAKKDLSNLTNAGKDVVTGLVNVVGTNGITVTKDTDDTSRVKTFTAKLDDKVTFGQGDKQITVDGTTGTITAPNATINVVNTNTVQVGDANKTNTAVTPEGVTVTTKQPDGTVTSTVIIKDGTVSGLTNTKWDPTKVTDTDRSKAATQGQMKDVSDTLQKGRVFTADTGAASATVALGKTLAIKGGAEGKLIDGNIGVELTDAKTENGVTTPATMMIRLKKDMDMQDGSTSYDHYMDIKGKSVKVATTKVDGTGVTITPVKGLDKPSVTLTADGLDNGGNPIHNVGPGTAPNDAATVGQVSAAAGTLSRRVNEVGAHAAALAAMNPLSYDPLKKSQVMAGYGSYKGNSALALGVAHYANEDTLFNVGVSVGNGENMVNAGVTYRFGGEDSMIPERYKGGPISSVYVMQDEITALKAENARKDVENAKKEAENEEMKAQIKMLIERVTMLEAKK